MHSKHLGEPGPCQACLLATLLFETAVSRVSHISALLISVVLCLYTAYTILELFLPKL